MTVKPGGYQYENDSLKIGNSATGVYKISKSVLLYAFHELARERSGQQIHLLKIFNKVPVAVNSLSTFMESN